MEFLSDVAYRLSGSNHAKDLVFAIGEKLVRGLLRVGFEIHNEFLCQGRADILAAANHFSDRLDEFCRRALFGKVPGCAGAQHTHGVLVLGVHAQNQYGQAGGFGVQLLEDVEAALVRHRNVEQDHITGLALDDLQGFVTVAGFARHGHSGIFGNDSLQAFAYDSVIINDNDFNHDCLED